MSRRRSERNIRRKQTPIEALWSNNGHHVILAVAAILVVLLGYFVGNLAFSGLKNAPPNSDLPPIISEDENEEEEPVAEGLQEEPEEEPIVEDREDEETNLDEPEESIKTITKEEITVVNYDVVEKEDSTLYSGERKVSVAGTLGEMTITYEVTLKDQVEVSRTKISEEITKEPVSRVILVGTKETKEVKTERISKTIPYATVYEEDDDLYVGHMETKRKGKDGIKFVTVEITYEKGVEISRKEIKEEIAAKPVDEIIITGTKPLDSETSPETNEPQPVG